MGQSSAHLDEKRTDIIHFLIPCWVGKWFPYFRDSSSAYCSVIRKMYLRTGLGLQSHLFCQGNEKAFFLTVSFLHWKIRSSHCISTSKLHNSFFFSTHISYCPPFVLHLEQPTFSQLYPILWIMNSLHLNSIRTFHSTCSCNTRDGIQVT